jgi:serine acetyltransferase
VGDGAYVAAGSVITENVPADALAVARGRQVNKPGWAAKRRRGMRAARHEPKVRTRRPKARPRKPKRRTTGKSKRKGSHHR